MDVFFRDPFGWVSRTWNDLLTGLGLSSELATLLLQLVGAVVLTGIVLTLSGVFLTWLDRKLSARIQDRLGPNRVGPYGLLQSVADAIKLVTKEDITPDGADKVVYNLAPLLAIMSVAGLWAVIPFAPQLIGTDLNVGLLYLISIGSIGTLSIIMAGWASNNKYALLGAFRTVAQLVSYEVPMVLALIIPTMLAGSMGMGDIVARQRDVWFVVLAPLAALIFFISSLAEVGRTPFDLMEAESEIVAGFNIEYSGMKFGMFYVAEFLHAFTISALTATIFLGGWQGPGAAAFPLLGLVYFLIKTAFVYFLLTLIRFTLPRIRIDQMNDLNWKFLTPLALAAVILTAVADKAALEAGWSRTGALLAANGAIALVTVLLLGRHARSLRRRLEARVARATGS
ncbi:MAG: NADH-quinone oxidoreductase subunit NuoH [Anaerolineales bacterium]